VTALPHLAGVVYQRAGLELKYRKHDHYRPFMGAIAVGPTAISGHETYGVAKIIQTPDLESAGRAELFGSGAYFFAATTKAYELKPDGEVN